ncbi:MAG: hypothetical protein AABX72_01205 [Nanoarchaeota archaeon]
MNIGVDCDEVLAQFIGSFLDYHNRLYGTQLCFEDCTRPELYHVLGETNAVTWQRMMDFWDTPTFDEIRPVSGSVEAVRELRKSNALEIVSSRHPGLLAKTETWIERHYEGCFSAIHFNGTDTNVLSRTKLDICRERQLDVLVEDSLSNALMCANGRRVYLLDKPWNQCSDLPSTITRVYYWDEVVRALLK